MSLTSSDAVGENIREQLAQFAAHVDCDSAKPEFFSLPEDAQRLEVRLRHRAVAFVHDTLDEQLGNLLESRQPDAKFDTVALDALVERHLDGMPIADYGHWVFFPWSRRLVHVLPKVEHRELRTDRNHYKITPEEQARLGTARIGIVGLSVGNMAAVTLALEGIGGSFRIADFDRLSLSNLNRLRGGVHELNINKTVLAAREMYEIDPYLAIERFPTGIDNDNLDSFLLDNGKLDLVIEECDDLYLKVRIRERCRELGIPVVMDTSDKGLFDIERFDREPDRPIFHGLVGEISAESLRGLSTKEKVPFVLDILETDAMSLRMSASLPEIDQSISAWPQLASGVALGGAITADATRRILLDQLHTSGRFYVDVEGAINNDCGAYRKPLPIRKEGSPCSESRQTPALPHMPSTHGDIDTETIQWLVSHAILAPSAHNAQPWQFIYHNGSLECRHDPSHDLPTLDFELGATWISFGAVLENLELAAGRIGLATTVETFPDSADPQLVYRMWFVKGPYHEDPLYEQIPHRITNRHRAMRGNIDDSILSSLIDITCESGAELHLATDPAALEILAGLVGACDRICFLNKAIHQEVMPGYRWNASEVTLHRDGLDIDAMELRPWERAGTKLLSAWPRMAFIRRVGGGKGLENLGREWVECASAVGLITVPDHGREQYLTAGKAIQRMWLKATFHALAIHPITGLPFLLARVERGGGEGLSADEIDQLQALREPFSRIFASTSNNCEAFLFRISQADPPTARSLRRHLDQFLTIGEV